jgi:hypothetical protein
MSATVTGGQAAHAAAGRPSKATLVNNNRFILCSPSETPDHAGKNVPDARHRIELVRFQLVEIE